MNKNAIGCSITMWYSLTRRALVPRYMSDVRSLSARCLPSGVFTRGHVTYCVFYFIGFAAIARAVEHVVGFVVIARGMLVTKHIFYVGFLSRFSFAGDHVDRQQVGPC